MPYPERRIARPEPATRSARRRAAGGAPSSSQDEAVGGEVRRAAGKRHVDRHVRRAAIDVEVDVRAIAEAAVRDAVARLDPQAHRLRARAVHEAELARVAPDRQGHVVKVDAVALAGVEVRNPIAVAERLSEASR